ncbi:MAG: beta-ketoacyl-[acyl-carrier-protein] synthase family protein [Dehalococcoidales bacterium]|nr:beta-ketoacyl-[acyl-carrier-protein] synthase family protein [Dehalococcoidales bacterium]
MQRVVVTGVGTVCPIGLNIEEYWGNLTAGKSGVGLIRKFDATDYPVKVAAEVKDLDPGKYMEPKTVERTTRTIHLVVPAAKEAVASAGLDIAQEQPERVGIVSANLQENRYVAQGFDTLAKRGPRRVDPLFFTKGAPSIVSLQLGMLFGAQGPSTSVNSLCASGADAIGCALNFIRLGYADVMIVATSDASLDEMTIAALSVIGALSREPDPDKACRPFDLNRSGFVYGEGSGVMILESYAHAMKRGAPILAELAGAGWTFDAYDTTAPQPDTEAMAMRIAIRNAGLGPEDIDCVNAHGTSTRLNDASETKAIKMVFGERAYRIPVTANKSMFGHMLSAGGMVESIGVVMSISRGIIPPTIHYETPDPECDLDYVPNVARRVQVNACLKNSFGLGGQNCCLVFKKFEEA